jgi:hypothetical protein
MVVVFEDEDIFFAAWTGLGIDLGAGTRSGP